MPEMDSRDVSWRARLEEKVFWVAREDLESRLQFKV